MAKPKEIKHISQPRPGEQTSTVVEPPGGTPHFYANLVQITWTTVDLKIRFAEMTKIDWPGHNTVTERAVVTMAWPQAKTLLNFLRDTLAGYEGVNGEIKIAPELKLPPGILPTPTES